MSLKTDKNLLPSLLFPGKTSAERKYMAQLKKQGLIYSIGPKLYASVPRTDLAKIVRGSWALIVSRLYSKALISHATALTYLPNAKGEVFLTSSSQRKVTLPGLTLCFLRGPKSDKNDVSFMNLKASSFERALLENLSASKGSFFQKSLSQADIENRLELILLHKGEDELNQCRERARAVSKRLKMETEFKKLDKIIGALLGSRSQNNLMDPLSKARSMGRPYDSYCLERLEILFSHLRHFPFVEIKETYKSSTHFRNKSFFESYFSNYIEGTIFDISEAESIVFDHKIPKQRPMDAHDILSTYKIVSDPNKMKITPKSDKDLLEILKTRHHLIFEKRSELMPGQFKLKNNRAGSTSFVPPDYVVGTLQMGFEIYNNLPRGLARSIFIMFLISDVHPFNDGNGRVSRLMMNAELYSEGLSTIIIPNVYREDYLLSLRALTRRLNPDPYTRMLTLAHSFSALDFSNYVQIKKIITENNWFDEASESKLIL